jgi:hypothetical protein
VEGPGGQAYVNRYQVAYGSFNTEREQVDSISPAHNDRNAFNLLWKEALAERVKALSPLDE